ncbi:GNAT family N-acetyltransferase [Bifidobacterium miconisargentati]|uniref:GNAT family N-acetyltransferase n=1 Tax=Bifidobacterium miconisargentati TaxID=2834437 RepID=UPI001BDBDDD8|nr:GNAT family N-acetyltransferase [Bifidobacterium miconisargentati]MBW3090767.1 GNAT family N-acetyltransferase [Bifidobacterium miconisargentati]
MAGTNEVLSMATDARMKRDLPERIVIPPIRGEMVHLRPATVEDLPRLDELDAFYGASKITGKDAATERAVVHTWVRRSQAWEAGQAPAESGVGDPESRRTIAWAVLTDADHDDDGKVDAASTGNVIGMIFLIDIDGWSRSARIQIVLGRDYRGRGYSRDAMPRVMTYGFAPEPAGLGMHRIWVGVPEKNSRSISVYQSLGFVPSGTSRDALWDAENNKYQDLIVMDTLVDEYDPIRSLDAFGMHLIEDNPGVKEALSAREHSIAIQQNIASPADAQDGDAGSDPDPKPAAAAPQRQETKEEQRNDSGANRIADEESNWPYGQNERKTSKEAWWRTLGRGRKRDTESE